VIAALKDRAVLLEVFALVNLAFLAVDIYVAHLVNEFANPLEWLPVVFSSIAPLALLPGLLRYRGFREGVGRIGGLVVGFASIGVGILGMVLHLNSHFFAAQTLQNLVYAAPFVAPLAYAGVGFLILLNRMVDVDKQEWGRWVLFFAMGGFCSNFGLSLLDHAQNGFFYKPEWIPVVASAAGIGFLVTAVAVEADDKLIKAGMLMMGVEILVGLLGAVLHVWADLTADVGLYDAFVYGAPAFAPMLFPDLALLAVIGLWHDLGFLERS